MKGYQNFILSLGMVCLTNQVSASGPEQLYDPCLSHLEAKATISTNQNEARIFDKAVLRKFIENNRDAMSKLDLINAARVLVLPVTHLGLENQCKQGVQVFFAFVDEAKELRSRHGMINRTQKAASNFLNKTKKLLSLDGGHFLS